MATTNWATIYGTASSASGTVPGRRPYINWRVTGQSVANNTSTVEFKVGSQPISQYGTSGTFSGTMKYNGVSRSISGSVPAGVANVFTTFNATIKHNADGKKSFTVSLTGSIPGTTGWTGTSLSSTITLPTIPRATTPTISPTTVDLGNALTISLPRASSSFTHTVSYSFAGATGTISSSAGTSVSWTPPVSLATNIPSKTSDTCTISVVTKNGTTTIGTKTATCTLRVPANVIPSYTGSPTVANNDSALVEKLGAATRYLQNVSKLKITTGAASGAQGSTINGYGITVGGGTEKVYTSNTNIVENLPYSGSVTISVRVRDTRGRWSSKKSKTITSTAYTEPSVNIQQIYRSDLSGNETSLGKYVTILHSGSIPSVLFGTSQMNSATLQLQYRIDGSTVAYTTRTVSTKTPATWKNERYTTPVTIPLDNAYEMRLTLTDKFSSSKISQTILPVAATAFSLSKTGAAAGKIWTSGAFDLGGRLHALDSSAAFQIFEDNRNVESTPQDMVDIIGKRGQKHNFKSRASLVVPNAVVGDYFAVTTTLPSTKHFTTPPLSQDFTDSDGASWRRISVAADTWGEWKCVGHPNPNTIVINGEAYLRTGRISVTRPTLSAIAGGYAASWNIDPPYTPPSGWGFEAHTPLTNGYGFVFFAGRGALSSGKLTLRFWANSASATLSSIGWTLVRN